MAKKYYAVRAGRTPGVYTSWPECQKNVIGFAGAIFKGFETEEEAKQFAFGSSGISYADAAKTANQTAKTSATKTSTTKTSTTKTSAASKSSAASTRSKKAVNEDSETSMPNSQSEAVAYVDGSYNITTKEYSYGAVIFHQGKEEHFSEKFDNQEMASMRNVAGEIEGSMCAMRYCVEHGIKSIDIYFDYQGIASWCLGEWKTNKEGTIAYKRYYDEIKSKVLVNFVKVKGHSGDKYNDLADSLAKAAVGII